MAKITFEDGTVVNFNGNPTPQDVEEVAKKLGIKKSSFIGDIKKSFQERGAKLSEGYTRQQQGKQGLAESVLQTAGQGAGVIGDVAFSGISRLASAITPNVIEKPVVSAIKSGASKLLSTKPVQSALSSYKKFEENQPRAAANIGAVANIASLVPIGKGGQVAGKTVLKSAGKVSSAAGKVATKTAELGAKTSKYGLSQVSGLGRDTIEQVIKNPKMFTKEVVSEMTRENIGKQIKEGITSRINKLQSVGKEYQPLRKIDKVVEVPKNIYTDVLNKYGLGLADGKLTMTAESKPFLSGELKQVEDFLAQYGSTKHTPNSALNAREALSNLSKFDTAKSNNLTSLAKDLRSNLNKVIQDDVLGIPGIKKIDDFYSKEISVLKDIRKDYFVKGTTEFKDNALSKIANLTKEGRQSVLKRLKEIDPNIEFKVNILRAVEDIKASGGLKVGTYTRGGVAAGGLATGNVPLLIGAIVAQPEILVPILRAFGKARIAQKSIIQSIEKKLKSGADLLFNEKSVLNRAIDDYAKKIGGKVSNIKPGLTIEDVSKKPLVSKVDKLISKEKSTFNIGGEEYTGNSIIKNNKKVGNVFVDKNGVGETEIVALKINPEFRKQGLGKQVVNELLKTENKIYIRSIPSAKKFWENVGVKFENFNKDAGLWEGYINKAKKPLTPKLDPKNFKTAEEYPSIEREIYMAKKNGKKLEEFLSDLKIDNLTDFLAKRLNGKPGKRNEILKGFEDTIGRGDEILFDNNRFGIRAGEFEDSIDISGLKLENTGSGLGSKIMNEIGLYAEIKDKPLTIFKVTNNKFFDKFSWLKKSGDNYVYEPSRKITNRFDFTKSTKSKLIDEWNK